jgi:hypothetical protein
VSARGAHQPARRSDFGPRGRQPLAEGGTRGGRAAPAQAAGAYRHRQFGRTIALGTGLGLALAAVTTLSLSAATLRAQWPFVVALFAIFVATFLIFATLTVEVDAREVRIRFGIGLIRRTVELADILHTEVIRTRVWWGWGLHWTPSGWLYNVAGREAVRLVLASAKPVIVGSDEALALKQAIDARRAAAGPRGAGGG